MSSLFQRAKEVTGDIASVSKKKAKAGKLELEVRRLESKVKSEKSGIGQALFPLLESGSLEVDSAEVRAHMGTIASLQAEIATKRAEIEVINQEDEPEVDRADLEPDADPT